ncbi:MAG: hypothetical protein HFI09_01690 [Bacilli bacterium]|nr:hypothetical protein [Bacilli bacterium]
MAIKDYYTENFDMANPQAMHDGYSMSDGPTHDARVSVVKITNLEEAVQRIGELSSTARLGVDLTNRMNRSIESLKECWKGSDAVVHIHNMIAQKSCVAAMSSVASDIAYHVHEEIETIQRKIEANGGNSVSIGAFAGISFGNSLKDNEEAVDTGEVYVDTGMAREQLSNLRSIKEDFFDFYEKYSKVHAYIMEIWVAGGARDYHEDSFNQFRQQIELMRSEFDDAIQALSKAISNWEAGSTGGSPSSGGPSGVSSSGPSGVSSSSSASSPASSGSSSSPSGASSAPGSSSANPSGPTSAPSSGPSASPSSPSGSTTGGVSPDDLANRLNNLGI